MALVNTLNSAFRRVPAWPVYAMGTLYTVWLFWQGLTGGLGVEPIKALEHALGEAGLKLLIVTLAITPLRRFTGVSLLKFRRALGLTAFGLIAVHLLVWLVLDVQVPAQIWVDIVKRPYITVGMAGFALMIPLAVTSNTWALRRMGAGWRRLHRLAYPATVLGGLHFVMLVKGYPPEPYIYLGVILGLLALRLKWRPGMRRA